MLAEILGWSFVVIFLLKVFKPFIIVKHGTVVMLDRFQSFYKLLKPGFHFVVPYLDVPHLVHWEHNVMVKGQWDTEVYESECIKTTECIFDLPSLDLYTADNVVVGVLFSVNYTITDAKKAVYDVSDLHKTMQRELETKLVKVVGGIKCDDLDGIKIEQGMKSSNGKDEWLEMGVKIGRCRTLEMKLPRRLDNACEASIEKETECKSDIASMAMTYERTVLRIENDIKVARKYAELRQVEADGEAELYEKQCKLDRKRRDAKLAYRVEELRAYSDLVKASGVPPEFFIQCMDKRALLKLASAEGGATTTTRLFVPITLGDSSAALVMSGGGETIVGANK